jgi:hypothetical protein
MPTFFHCRAKPVSRGSHCEPLAVALRFQRGRLVVALDDEREVSVPLDRYPSLLRASSRERANFQIIGPGKGFHWPSLDLDLSVRGIVSGLPEVVPVPPKTKTKRSAQK